MQHSTRLIFVSLILIASSFCALAQTPAPPVVPQAPVSDSNRRLNADEKFELNIDERRISEENFEASTGVGTEEDSRGGLNLQVGVALAAGRIDVLLRNVRGSVRFRGTLDRVLEMMSNRRTVSKPPTPK